MGEYLKVDGHRDLVRDTRTGAILNKTCDILCPLRIMSGKF